MALRRGPPHARRTLANHRRGEGRRTALGERLRHDLSSTVPDHAFAVTEQETVRAALGRLADRDREILELAAWEELEPREIAEVLGISAVAVRSRLSRSRARLRQVLGNDPPVAGHLTSTYSRLVPEEAP
ncbi:MAG: sigma-70 family RNA polymerase sigma factor [Nocardioides sp.]